MQFRIEFETRVELDSRIYSKSKAIKAASGEFRREIRARDEVTRLKLDATGVDQMGTQQEPWNVIVEGSIEIDADSAEDALVIFDLWRPDADDLAEVKLVKRLD
jgi:hypothetical protein